MNDKNYDIEGSHFVNDRYLGKIISLPIAFQQAITVFVSYSLSISNTANIVILLRSR